MNGEGERGYYRTKKVFQNKPHSSADQKPF